MNDLKIYFDNTQKPWGKLFYRIIWEQLSFAKSLKLLDFGSGFGITANQMAASNDVTAVEPNRKMCEMSIRDNHYTQIIGGIETLNEFPNESIDLIICHNVLEYVDNKEEYITKFCQLLKTGGKLSLVKHNHSGRIMHKVVFENDITQAKQLMDGSPAIAQNFGEIKYYDMADIDQWGRMFHLKQLDNLGVRAFFALNPDNSIRYNENWINSMYELELKASKMEEFRNVAFFNHVFLEKL